MREKTVCFTGHREMPADQLKTILQSTADAVFNLYERGYRIFCVGGALGYDTLAARVVLALRQRYPDVRLHLYLPCPEQADKWSDSDRKMYEVIKKAADAVTVCSPHYTRFCMHERNRQLVNASSVCICYLTKQTGGTAYTVRYATEKGLEVIIV